MSAPDELRREIAALRARISALGAASLRISASLDLETVRAEEIALSVPDGCSLTTLINATPIHAGDGALASVVVTRSTTIRRPCAMSATR